MSDVYFSTRRRSVVTSLTVRHAIPGENADMLIGHVIKITRIPPGQPEKAITEEYRIVTATPSYPGLVDLALELV